MNGDYVELSEVKKTLHKNDVRKIRDRLLLRFRSMYPEYKDKKLLVLVAGEEIHTDVAEAVTEWDSYYQGSSE